MRQQVNLYRDDLRPQRAPLQAGAALALVLLTVLLLVLVAVLQQRAVTGSESVLAGLTQQVASLHPTLRSWPPSWPPAGMIRDWSRN